MQPERIISQYDIHWPALIQLYVASFPEVERRDIDALERLLSDPRFHAYKIVIDSNMVALMLYWQLEKAVFLEHLAVEKPMQKRSLGKRMMQWLLNKNASFFLLEVEHPLDDTSQRRIHFYERLGFSANHYKYFQPPYRHTNDPLPLLLMSLPAIESDKTFELLTKELHATVYNR